MLEAMKENEMGEATWFVRGSTIYTIETEHKPAAHLLFISGLDNICLHQLFKYILSVFF